MVAGSSLASEKKNFFENLSPISDYRNICDLDLYVDVPRDWVMVLCDIRGSTKSIQEGRYKDVNFLGASCIIALVNKFKGHAIPYVFGGDGATLLLPPEFVEESKSALGHVQNMAKSQYQMELRVALIPIAELTKENFSFKIAKYALSPDISIALFKGNGFFEAEARVKNNGAYLLEEKYSEASVAANMEGLECRWESIPAKRDEIITVLIKATSKDLEEAALVYKNIIAEITEIVGDRENVSPVSEDRLKLTLNPKKLSVEAKAKTRGLLSQLLFLVIMFLQTILGFFLMTFQVKTKNSNWGLYKRKVSKHSDYWKFDDTLRFVFDVTQKQKSVLVWILEKYKGQKLIHYGTHSSSSALMTCLIFNRENQHVHFIDGSDGGYALAATQLKQSMKNY